MTSSQAGPPASASTRVTCQTDAEAAIPVGSRLRVVRTRRRMTLKEVATAAGVTESFLSQVERGLANASIATLQRIVGALGLSIGDLFDPVDDARPRLHRAAEQPTLHFGVGCRKQLLSPKWSEQLEVLRVSLAPGATTGPESYSHGDSEELLFVLTGTIRVLVGDREYRLEPGDSLMYRSSVPHHAENAGTTEATCFWVISPPSY